MCSNSEYAFFAVDIGTSRKARCAPKHKATNQPEGSEPKGVFLDEGANQNQIDRPRMNQTQEAETYRELNFRRVNMATPNGDTETSHEVPPLEFSM
jgi:hypothetical protein